VTRSSPRKNVRSLCEEEEVEESVLVPKSSRRDLRDTANRSQEGHSLGADQTNAHRAPTNPARPLPTPRKQRILRPVESNSRLLRKLSNESLASPEKRQKDRRVRSSTTDTDVGKKTRLLYAKTLAKSVVKTQASRTKIDVLGEEESRLSERKKKAVEEVLEVEVEAEEDVETSLWCGDEDATSQDKEETPVIEISDDEDEDPIVNVRQRRQRPQTRRVESDSEDEEEEVEPAYPVRKTSASSARRPVSEAAAVPEPTPLTSMRPPHKNGHSTISDWAQEVIDLTDSPEAPSSFVAPPLPPPTRVRTASFASSRPQTSSSNSGGLAMLTYSPTPTKLRSPVKAPPMSRPATPSRAPSSPSKLVSPSKKKPAIPKADLRPSLDAFWNPEVVNEWNEKHSPVKTLVSPKKQKWRDDIVKMMEGVALDDESDDSDAQAPSPTTSPRKKPTKATSSRSPVKKLVLDSASPDVKAIRAERKTFLTEREAMASSFLAELDQTICAGRIQHLSAPTGGIHLIWSNTLRSTAGRANWRRETIRLRTGPAPTDFTTAIRHHCSIELAVKVIDTPERLYNVLAHEFCHLTTFMISDVRNNPHGAEFKSWGRKASEAFGHRGVQVTTKHSYAIEYKFVWECVGCGYVFKRHSKSVDTERHSCGKCKGRLVQIKPVPRGGKGAGEGKGKSEYQVFVKEHFARVKKGLVEGGRDAGMGRVMEAVAGEYRDMKEGKGAVGDAGVGGERELEDALEGLKI